MRNPPHSREILHHDVAPALDVSVMAAARVRGVTRAALSRVLHGLAGNVADAEVWAKQVC
jgi:antitoxin HigA-1